MVAYANREAIERTISTGYAHYYSRSRQKIWKKGETSGNVQKVKRILLDCDSDTLLYVVEQKGVACHTGEYSCFFRTVAERKDE
ncbi:MAG: phosphoribosyl-AMP cyclohydrolase [Desulfurobacterium sp.]|nr:MAG: phosphoribosyl-AMP cyclohydrolase [Desulfurobacterium sp.]